MCTNVGLLKAEVSLQLWKIFCLKNEVSVNVLIYVLAFTLAYS